MLGGLWSFYISQVSVKRELFFPRRLLFLSNQIISFSHYFLVITYTTSWVQMFIGHVLQVEPYKPEASNTEIKARFVISQSSLTSWPYSGFFSTKILEWLAIPFSILFYRWRNWGKQGLIEIELNWTNCGTCV